MREYDPVKAKEYYERTKQLKGRDKGSAEDPKSGSRPPKAPPASDRQAVRAAAAARVKSLNDKLTKLRAALTAARAKSRDKPSAAESKSKDAAYNKKHYAENKNEIANDRKAKARSAPDKPEAAKPAARGVEEIEAAIRTTLVELKSAIAKLKAL
jgi:hypothetical protein